jgi:hypothetical protein
MSRDPEPKVDQAPAKTGTCWFADPTGPLLGHVIAEASEGLFVIGLGLGERVG